MSYKLMRESWASKDFGRHCIADKSTLKLKQNDNYRLRISGFISTTWYAIQKVQQEAIWK